MKYYEMTHNLRSLDEIIADMAGGIERDEPLIPGMDGTYVKNRDAFFKTREMGPDKFYDHDYEFDYLVPKAFGDPEPEAELIADYHMWHGKSPRGGTTSVVSSKFKDVLEQFNLTASKFYKAKVLYREEFHPYYVWQVLQWEYKRYVDFDLTEFNNLNSYRRLNNDKFEVRKFSSIEELDDYREEHWNYDWNYERLVMKPEFREIDFTMMPNFHFIVSQRLKEAIEEADLLGVGFAELQVAIEFSDE